MAGRPRQQRMLDVWMNGERVGEWSAGPRGQAFTYDPAWLASPRVRPLSLSMPLEAGRIPGARVESFFENLLPDSKTIRKRLAERFGTGTQAVQLLEKIGRDCVGAVQLLPGGEAPGRVRQIEAQALDEPQIERLLERTISDEPAWAGSPEDDFRISLAGAQEKTALLWHENRWCRPLGATPTTHILKLPLGLVGGMQADFSTSVENEFLCAKILRAFGLPVANCRIERFGRFKVLVVERFDRREVIGLDANGHPARRWLARLPQEDLCQALGVAPDKKYEKDGGPGISSILQLLRGSSAALQDRERFFTAQVLFWMLAAPDGHAKNFSLALLPGGSFQMTPLYDVLSAWPIIGRGARQFQWQDAKLAMAVSGQSRHYPMSLIQRRHWNHTAKLNGLGVDFEPALQRLIARAPQAIDEVTRQLPVGFPAQVSGPVFEGLLAQVRALAQQPPG